MEKISIWRVENQNGHGPYRISKLVHDALYYMLRDTQCSQTKKDNVWQVPKRDESFKDVFNMRSRNVNYHFGFKDFDQYQQWFFSPAMRQYLHGKGFMLVEYKVASKSVVFGGKQIAFDIRDAEPISYVPCFEGADMQTADDRMDRRFAKLKMRRKNPPAKKEKPLIPVQKRFAAFAKTPRYP